VARRTAAEALATRERLLEVATARFVADGYASVSVDEVAAGAEVTRGALYHHFPDGKHALFEEIYRRALAGLDAELSAAGLRAAEETGDLWTALQAGTERYLQACLDPAFTRIVLFEGPVALGFERWEAIDLAFSVAQVEGILQLLIATGELSEQPVGPLARILVGGFNMAGRQIATADDPARAVAEFGEAFRRLVAGLRAAAAPDHREAHPG
jgi:AcrR family transcriptional regulator